MFECYQELLLFTDSSKTEIRFQPNIRVGISNQHANRHGINVYYDYNEVLTVAATLRMLRRFLKLNSVARKGIWTLYPRFDFTNCSSEEMIADLEPTVVYVEDPTRAVEITYPTKRRNAFGVFLNYDQRGSLKTILGAKQNVLQNLQFIKGPIWRPNKDLKVHLFGRFTNLSIGDAISTLSAEGQKTHALP